MANGISCEFMGTDFGDERHTRGAWTPSFNHHIRASERAIGLSPVATAASNPSFSRFQPARLVTKRHSEVHEEIARQATLDPAPSLTEILMLEARVLEARSEGTETVISVLLDAMLREDGPSATAEQVREVWHIRRDESASPPQWTLEGIQQLEV